MDPIITRKRMMTAAVAFVVICAVSIGLYFFLNRGSTLTISTEQSADISITTEQGGAFKKIGTGQATYKAEEFPVTVYVLAEKDGKKSLTGVLMERGKNPTVELALSSTIPAQKISDGAVLSAYFDGTNVQGIAPGDGSLTSFRTDTFGTTRPDFVGMPYMSKVIWYDLNNFIYQTDSRAVGQFRDGSDLGTGFLRGNITGKITTDVGEIDSEDTSIPATDIAQAPGKPLVLMSSTNIFTSDTKGSKLHAIVKFDINTEENALFASDQSIFRVSSRQAGDVAEDTKEPEHNVTIAEYDYSGKQLNTYRLSDESPVVSVTKNKDSIYVLTKANLYVIKNTKDAPQKLGVYFGRASDMVLYKGAVVILGDDGLWKLNDNGESLQLLYDYSKNGVGLAGSLSITPDGRLIFGTEPRTDKTDQVGAMFSTSL